mmetsp:Transcript_79742/g.221800  ORF Transcript_79742/g.221800 Transcript_79742/m.221800 type:complete len:209 (+) Transcript_79742:645-1271(+)
MVNAAVLRARVHDAVVAPDVGLCSAVLEEAEHIDGLVQSPGLRISVEHGVQRHGVGLDIVAPHLFQPPCRIVWPVRLRASVDNGADEDLVSNEVRRMLPHPLESLLHVALLRRRLRELPDGLEVRGDAAAQHAGVPLLRPGDVAPVGASLQYQVVQNGILGGLLCARQSRLTIALRQDPLERLLGATYVAHCGEPVDVVFLSLPSLAR